MVMVLPPNDAVTPAGNFDGAPMPVAPVVAWVITGITVLIQTVGEDEAAPAVLLAVTVIVPVAAIPPQPPVKGIV